MKLQNLLIIFIVIALPVLLILQAYMGYQVDTVLLRAKYDSRLLGSTYDAVEAFQLNTTKNKYSTVSDSLIRDIEASINTFSTAFSTAIRKTGASKGDVMSYVPAIVYTLYDGFYIYTPITTLDASNNITIETELKPYIYYTRKYENGLNKSLIINYSLDNYVTVYVYDKLEKTYTSKAGYLEVLANSSLENGLYVTTTGDNTKVYYNTKEIDKTEALTINKNGNGLTTEDSSDAYNYYKEAYEFSKWYNDLIKTIFGVGSDNYKKLYIDSNNSALPYESSAFNQEKEDVIKESINDNLIQSLEINRKRLSIEFKMPKFTEIDWDKIYHNICMITFMQGMPLGTSAYNNYVIVPSTENKQYVDEQTIYYIGYGGTGTNEADNCYHRIGCEHLKGDTIVRIQQNRIFCARTN